MLIIKNRYNEVITTLQERQTLTGTTYFLFSVRSESTKQTVNFIPTLLSTNTRYDLFSLTETGSTYSNLTGGTVNLQEGWHSYAVYEQLSPTNLSLSSTGKLLEQGLILVSAITPQITYNGNSEPMNYNFYNGQ